MHGVTMKIGSGCYSLLRTVLRAVELLEEPEMHFMLTLVAQSHVIITV